MYKTEPRWRGQYLPWGKGPTNYAPLPKPFTMRPPKKGLGGGRGLGLSLLADHVDTATGNIIDITGAVVGNCGVTADWLMMTDCWAGGLPSSWAAQFPLLSSGNVVSPPAPSQSQVAAALTCPDPTLSPEDCASLIAQQAAALAQSLSNSSVVATQAANSTQMASIANANQAATSGCDPTSDPLQCLGGLAWYWWAAIAGGAIVLISVMKR